MDNGFSLPAIFLGLISLCLVILTVTSLVILAELRRTATRVNALLVRADRAIRDAQHAARLGRRLLLRADAAGEAVGQVIGRVCESASAALDQWAGWQDRMRAFWSHRLGNGARGEPRSGYRRGR